MPRPAHAHALAFAFAFALAFAFAFALSACSPPLRDVVPETHDVRVTPDAGPSPAKDGYVFVARRSHSAVGLIGAHHMSDADAHRIVDRIADDLDACARRVLARGELASGAAQLVAASGPRGTADVTDVRLAPGGPVAANALECIVAPLRAMTFPPIGDAGLPALAIEATWGPERSTDIDAGGGV